jgi:hypothetical protein
MTTGFLSASETDWARMAAAQTAVVLIGSFDGSGNVGDLAQTREALDRVNAAKSDGVVVGVVVEAQYADTLPWTDRLLKDVVTLRYSDEPPETGLVEFLPAACMVYLTGGGYINATWGNRKLGQLETVNSLVAGGGASVGHMLASGLQVSDYDDLWRWNDWLCASRPLLVRDEESRDVLTRLGVPTESIDLGDDAAGYLPSLEIDDAGPSCVNVHINVASYSSDDPAARNRWFADALTALAASHAGLRCKLLIAFDDARVGEREAAADLVASCNAAANDGGHPAIEFEVVSLPNAVIEHDRMALGSLGTLTCSYHVGMLSLLHRRPTLLLAENSYYEQKMRALAAMFGLGDEALVRGWEPIDVAGRLAEVACRLEVTHEFALRATRANSWAMRWAVAHRIAEFERDAMWAKLEGMLPVYRAAVAESADMHRRVGVVSSWLDDERSQNEARIRRMADMVATLRRRVSELEGGR